MCVLKPADRRDREDKLHDVSNVTLDYIRYPFFLSFYYTRRLSFMCLYYISPYTRNFSDQRQKESLFLVINSIHKHIHKYNYLSMFYCMFSRSYWNRNKDEENRTKEKQRHRLDQSSHTTSAQILERIWDMRISIQQKLVSKQPIPSVSSNVMFVSVECNKDDETNRNKKTTHTHYPYMQTKMEK